MSIINSLESYFSIGIKFEFFYLLVSPAPFRASVILMSESLGFSGPTSRISGSPSSSCVFQSERSPLTRPGFDSFCGYAESAGESADSLHLLPSLPSQHHQLFSLPLYLSAETAHLIVYARLVHQHCEFMNQTLPAAPHLVLLTALSTGNALLPLVFLIAHRIC